MMWYVRSVDGVIVGLYANPQPQPDGTSLTEAEPVADDHPEVVEFVGRQEAAMATAVKRAAAIRALDEQRLLDAAGDPAAPAAVKAYSEAVK